jgi:hypothetical protein
MVPLILFSPDRHISKRRKPAQGADFPIFTLVFVKTQLNANCV